MEQHTIWPAQHTNKREPSFSHRFRLEKTIMVSSKPSPMKQVAIIGVGEVGAATADALILGSIADELLCVDKKVNLRDAQVQDLSDVACCRNSKTSVRSANYHEAGQTDIVIITAGSKETYGEQYRYLIKKRNLRSS